MYANVMGNSINDEWRFLEPLYIEKNITINNATFFLCELVFENKNCSIQANNSHFFGCTFVEHENGKMVGEKTIPFAGKNNCTITSRKSVGLFFGTFLLLSWGICKNGKAIKEFLCGAGW